LENGRGLYGQLHPFFPSQGTNLIEPLQEHTETKAIFAHFIDEYRLFGKAGRETTLWDSTGTHNPQVSSGLVFELGPDYILDINEDRDTHNHETNHTLPFRESDSMSITGFMVYTKHSTMTKQLLIFRVRDLVGFADKIGTVAHVPWQDWLHFATLIELPLVSPHIRIFRSQVLNVCGTDASTEPASIRVWDFSLRSRRQQAQDDPSAPLPLYTIREFPLDAEYRRSAFRITEGGVLVTSVRIRAIASHAKVLT
jgi:hypothetical protein